MRATITLLLIGLTVIWLTAPVAGQSVQIEVKDGVSRLTNIVATHQFNQVSLHVILQAVTANQQRTLSLSSTLKPLLNELPAWVLVAQAGGSQSIELKAPLALINSLPPELQHKFIYLPLIRR